jgi:hypothetical protein
MSAIGQDSTGIVAFRPDSYLPSAPRMPATIPSTAPTMKPPPIMKLSTAKGMTSIPPNTPRLSAIINPPAITMNPSMRPMSTAIDCTMLGGPLSQKNIRDQLVGGPKNPDDVRATAFSNISAADIIASMNPQIAVLPRNAAARVGTGLVTTRYWQRTNLNSEMTSTEREFD